MPQLGGEGAPPVQAWDMGTRRAWSSIAMNRRQMEDLPEAKVTETFAANAAATGGDQVLVAEEQCFILLHSEGSLGSSGRVDT